MPILNCALCHQPQGDEFGPSVAAAHTIPEKSKQLPGIVFDLLKIDGGKPGENPAVTFSLKNKKGEPLDASKMDNLRLVLAWPTSEYETYIEEDVRKAQSLGNDVYAHRFKYTVPLEAKGSGAIAVQGYKTQDLKKADGEAMKGIRDVGLNVVRYFPITDREAAPRRKVVTTQSCNACHGDLSSHGDARRNTEFCAMCHNPFQTDEVKRKTAKGSGPPENIQFAMLVHKIHTGEELSSPLVVYGGSPAKPGAIDFTEVKYPGDRRNCEKCHEKGTHEIPLSAGVLPVALPQVNGSVRHLPPITSACTACHTEDSAMAHAEAMTASGGRESCVVCHGQGRDFSVRKMHSPGEREGS